MDLWADEEFFGCYCMSSSHVVHLVCFRSDDKNDEENNIYLICSFEQFREGIIPHPLDFKDIFRFDFWAQYFRDSWWGRIPIAIRYIFSKRSSFVKTDPKQPVIDNMNFQNRDLDILYNFLSKISNKEECKINAICWLNQNNYIWDGLFFIDKDDYIKENQLGFEIDFIYRRSFLKRVWHALKYLFNFNGGREVHFEISEKEASEIKGMIRWIQKENKKIQNSLNN